MRLRHRLWFDGEGVDMTAIYLERYLNYGLTREELQGDRPIVGIAQTGSDLSPCNRHHLQLAARVRDGIRSAGGVPLEFPVHPIQETGRRPTAALDRNLAYLGLVEVLHGYPLDGVVLLTGCDKTTPALLMAAATADLPAIVLSGGPMLDGWWNGALAGSGTVIWQGREDYAAGRIGREELIEQAASSAPSAGHCNTMGTASTMNALAEALGMSLPGCASIPAPYRERAQMAYRTGVRAVELVREDVRPARVLTREAFENAIVACSAIGGATNAPIHLNAIARCVGVPLANADWERVGHAIPLLVNVQPAGAFLGEAYHRAGGLPAVLGALIRADLLPHPDTSTVNGRTHRENCADAVSVDAEVILDPAQPLLAEAGFLDLGGNLFDSALMKTSVISPEFRARYLANPDDPGAFEVRAVVFDGPEDYHARIDDPGLVPDEDVLLVMRGAGAIAYPGSAEVVNMRPPAALIQTGVHNLPCLGDGRQSGTSGSPSILNASPEAAAGGNLALVRTGDRVRVDLPRRRVDLLVPEDELAARRAELEAAGGYPVRSSQTPWQALHREQVRQLSEGMTLRVADGFHRVCESEPRHNH